MPRPLRRALAAVASLLVLALAGLVTVPHAAAAERLGGVMWSDTKGTSQSLLSIYSEGPCPGSAEYVKATAWGHGFPADGQTIVSPTRLLVSKKQPMGLAVSDAFVIYAEDNATTLDGRYVVKIQCTDRFGLTSVGDFTTSMTWTTPGGKKSNVARARYAAVSTADVDLDRVYVPEADVVAQEMAAPDVAPTATASGPVDDEPAADGPADQGPGAAGDANPTDGAVAPTPSAGASPGSQAAAGTAAAGPASDDDGVPVWVWVLAGGAAVAVASGLVLRTRGGSDA